MLVGGMAVAALCLTGITGATSTAAAADKPDSRDGPETWDTSGNVSGWFEHSGDKLVAWDSAADGKSAVLTGYLQHYDQRDWRVYCDPLWNAKGHGYQVKRTCDGRAASYTPEHWYVYYFPCTGEYEGREIGNCGLRQGNGVS